MLVHRCSSLAALISTVALAGSCTRANPDFCSNNDDCAAGSVCNLDATNSNAQLNECIDFSCTPEESLGCVDAASEQACTADGLGTEIRDCGGFTCNPDRGGCNECEPNTISCGLNADQLDEFVDCAADGTFNDSRECLLGCSTERVGCVSVDPQNGLRDDLTFIDGNPNAVRDLVLGDGFVVNSDTGEILDGDSNAIEAVSTRIENQGAPLHDIMVFRVRSLSVEGDVTFVGDLAIAFVSDRDILINGLIDVTAGDLTTGDSCVGGAPGTSAPESGGGGGGHGSNGGNGGDAAQTGGGGGSQLGGDLSPLTGGCQGGVGDNGVLRGGLGGGSVQLVSRQRIILGPSGQITASGKGGGHEGMVTPGAASGGGSGGGILLEAGGISFSGGSFVSANGGGGGCAGAVGARSLTRAPAAGATCVGEGSGGAGASAMNNADGGQDGMGTRGGGGGGGVGRIRVSVRPADQGFDETLFFSPDPQVDDVNTNQ